MSKRTMKRVVLFAAIGLVATGLSYFFTQTTAKIYEPTLTGYDASQDLVGHLCTNVNDSSPLGPPTTDHGLPLGYYMRGPELASDDCPISGKTITNFSVSLFLADSALYALLAGAVITLFAYFPKHKKKMLASTHGTERT